MASWFTITTNANEITITGYDIGGGTDVVIPDYINGLPVTKIGENAFNGSSVTSIKGAGNVVTVEDDAFASCGSLASVYLPQAHTVEGYAFVDCGSGLCLTHPHWQHTIGIVKSHCGSHLNFVAVHTVGNRAFSGCNALTSVYFDNDAPLIGVDIFNYIPANQVTNYAQDAIRAPDVTAQYSAWTTNVIGGIGHTLAEDQRHTYHGEERTVTTHGKESEKTDCLVATADIVAFADICELGNGFR